MLALDWEILARGVLATVGDAVVIADHTGLIRLCNAATEKLFGYAPGELAGKKINVLMPAYEAAHHDEYMHRYLATRQSEFVGRGPREIIAQSKDGTSIALNITVNVLATGGEPMFVAAMSEPREELRGEELGFVAEHDSLTGLYNYHYLQEELERVVGRVERGQEQTSALLYLDIDGFKDVNELYGHEEGDRILAELAKLILRRSRKSDVATRLYADKFAVLLFGVGDEYLSSVAESFRALADGLKAGEGKRAVRVSSVILPMRKDSPHLKELLKAAEESCRLAKAQGGSRSVVVPPAGAQR
jgi:diguanylate cyclase (GGDEF)-like protein/PAS domain S-box-containing protein